MTLSRTKIGLSSDVAEVPQHQEIVVDALSEYARLDKRSRGLVASLVGNGQFAQGVWWCSGGTDPSGTDA
jgi:hypothetical protein